MAGELKFEGIKNIPIRHQLCVSGYIRRSQSFLFPSDNVYYTISELIHYTILFFYYITFKWETIHDKLKLINNDTEVIATEWDLRC